MDCNCETCGANLKYQPGSMALSCEYCGHKMVFGDKAETANNDRQAVQELDLEAYLEKLENGADLEQKTCVSCEDCGAKTQFTDSIISGNCAFCDAPLVAGQSGSERLIKPAAVLPFALEKDRAQIQAHTWIKKRWFAPNEFKKLLKRHQQFRGIYLPFWTYDCSTFSTYVGQRGTHYYVTVSAGKGKTRRVQKTRWSMRSGKVSHAFDDILVPASSGLPNRKLEALEPWDLPELKDYQDHYLRGFIAEAYQVNLRAGYEAARIKMDDRIRSKVRRDIGGDEQRILSLNTHYESATFKHILLPVWVTPYRYKNKVYQLLVNARTGEVQGERPWSWIKIGSLSLGICALIALGVYFANST